MNADEHHQWELEQQEQLAKDPAYAKWSEHISNQAIKEQENERTSRNTE